MLTVESDKREITQSEHESHSAWMSFNFKGMPTYDRSQHTMAAQ